jgi:hypothetical protein
MIERACDWTLDLAIRCRLSILEARLMTQNRVTVVAGKNGCGKSQLLTIMRSYINTGDMFLQNLGYRNYFAKDRSFVSISGPKRTRSLMSSRTIGKDPNERVAGPYQFGQLEGHDTSRHYNNFRKSVSRLALEADARYCEQRGWHDKAKRNSKEQALKTITSGFATLFPGLSLHTLIDHEKQEVSVFGGREDMAFIRPEDHTFSLRIPFATLSDGELEALLLLYEIATQLAASQTPILFLVDEIENHLHPALLVRFMNLLQTMLPPFAMLLTTTHSPQVIASVPAASRVLMVHSSEISSTKSKNQLRVSSDDAGAAKILYDLYGAESGLAARDFLRDLATATAAEILAYAQANLLEAHAFSGSVPSDPQRTFLAGLVHAKKPVGVPFRMLDIGAGQGRLIKGLRTDLRTSKDSVLQVDTVEPNAEYRKTLLELADGDQGAVLVGKVFESIDDIADEDNYALILFHNVVHEISARKLVPTFKRALDRLLVGGAISILEQAVLPQGEKRYFVFQVSALCKMFEDLGLSSTATSRTSRSGVPIYELTVVKVADTVPKANLLLDSMVSAVERTIEANRQSYLAISDNPSKPVELAFLAFNIVNGEILLSSLYSQRDRGDG